MAQALMHAVRSTASIQFDQVEKSHRGGGCSLAPFWSGDIQDSRFDNRIGRADASVFAADADAAHGAAAWYALAVTPGREHSMARRIMRTMDDSASAAIVFERELPRRVRGAWSTVREILFPGYVVVSTADADALEREIENRTEAFGPHVEPSPIRLDDRAVDLLARMAGERGVLRMSVGDIVDGHLTVRFGALKGVEHLVARIDRHKRLAYLQTGLFGDAERGMSAWGSSAGESGRRTGAARELGLCLGLEVVAKS